MWDTSYQATAYNLSTEKRKKCASNRQIPYSLQIITMHPLQLDICQMCNKISNEKTLTFESKIYNFIYLCFLFFHFFVPAFSCEQNVRQSSKESTGSSDTDSSSEDESQQAGATNVPSGTLQPDKIAQQKESEAGAEISALVNYVQPVHFTSFEASESE